MNLLQFNLLTKDEKSFWIEEEGVFENQRELNGYTIRTYSMFDTFFVETWAKEDKRIILMKGMATASSIFETAPPVAEIEIEDLFQC